MVGDAIIQITFNRLGLVIDVNFAMIDKYVPTLFSNKDMIYNCLDLSLQGKFLHIGPLRKPLTIENYIFI